MPVQRSVPNLAGIISRLEARIGKLEKRLSQVIDARRLPALFSFAGAPDENVPSPPWRPVHPTEIDLIVPQVGTAPTGTDMTIDLSIDGTVVRTLTIPAGDFYTEDAVPFVIPMGSILTATVTAASGAEDLAISLIPKLL